MKKMWIILPFLCLILLLVLPFVTRANPASNKRQNLKKQYNKLLLLPHSTEQHYLPTHELVVAQYKICPPLRPERFRRRVKILWGIDINDYPENSTITANGSLLLSTKYQLIKGFNLMMTDDPDIVPIAPPLTDDIYSLCRQYLFLAEPSVLSQLKDNKYTYTDEVLKLSKEYLMYKNDFVRSYDILTKSYKSIIMVPISLLEYIDDKDPKTGTSGSNKLNNAINIGTLISERTFDLKGDLLSLYIQEQCKTRRLMVKSFDKNEEIADIVISCSGIELTRNPTKYSGELEMHFPWHNYNFVRSFAGNLSFLIQLQNRSINSYIIKYMTGQFDASDTRSYDRKERQDSIRENIRTNNYYGYALLREFCENPEREMPTLEKVGKSFNAAVTNSNTLLYLEPYSDSYDIDTIQPTEVFKAYEMGYDDYYFVEVIKPVESPVAGPDGYAMILDRTETVYGYIKKSAIKEVTESETISHQIKTQSGERKRGLIDDPDGYVNIRKESNSESEIIGKIGEKELFFYWEVPNSDWWYVQTKDDVNGFVHKSRIREKIDAGGWILDE